MPLPTLRRCLHIALLCALGAVAAAARAQSTPEGLWKTVDDETGQARSLIRISASAGVYTARIEKLLEPGRRPDTVCEKCTDERKDRPLVGMTLMKGVTHSESDPERWDGGEILDPGNGKVYKVRLTPAGDGKTMAVRGYIGTPLLGRTQTWQRVE